MATFPVPNWTHAGFHHNAQGGARYFGANRSHGRRLHAACDLIAPVGSPIYAVADGVIKQNPYFFYLDTNALEVVHHGYHDYVFRYGEISPYKVVKTIRAGVRVKEGDLIAYVGRLSTGSSMLHLELYSPEAGASGVSLTQRAGGRYQRSRFLLDPTAHIDSWLTRRPLTVAPQGGPPAAPARPAAPAPPAAPRAAAAARPAAPPAAAPPSASAAPRPSAAAPQPASATPAAPRLSAEAPPPAAPHMPDAEHSAPSKASPVKLYFFLKE